MQVLLGADPRANDLAMRLKQMQELGYAGTPPYQQTEQELAQSPIGKLYAAASIDMHIRLF